MDSRSTASIGGLAALAVAAAGLTVTAPPASGAASASGLVPGECRVVRMKQAAGFRDGSIIDLERVGDQVLYYGNGFTGPRDRERQRAFLWSGLRAEPQMIGPRAKRYAYVVALELTESGMVNGTAESRDGSIARSWVMDLATGDLQWYDVDSGPRGEDHGFTWIRRIDDAGAGAGTAVRNDDGETEPGTDAVGFDDPGAQMEFLTHPVDYLESGAFGINNLGQRVGYYADEFFYPEEQFWTIWQPSVWEADGSRTVLPTPYGIEGFPRVIEDDGGIGGAIAVGDTPETSHVEAGYWPDPETNIGLGLLPGGDYSEAYGGDAAGHLTGLANRRSESRFARHGYVDHTFWWAPETGEGRIRVLPSVYGDRRDLGWRTWVAGAGHAVDSETDRAGTTTHVGFDGRRLVFAPTVYVNASACGREVTTSHELPADGRRDPGSLLRDWKRTALD
ncbi:hypothetical protein GCM10009623_16270 [Nocardioides aestuarii]|uniref:DUF4185 domain-containing protein n=1 Tax=Nocardioides aestuarii TaxID=252231 RepID=A0ABW4TM37_9ACTN